MKKLLILFVVIPFVVNGQHLGFNGAGFFENVDEQSMKWLEEWDAPFTLRVPGGAISKFHDPYNVRKGWGMSEESVENWFNSVGFDEDGQGMDKWLRKVSQQHDYSYLDALVDMQKRFPAMRVLYVLNVLNSTPEANMQAIRYLINNGVNVTGVEAGNEIYGKYADFSEYVRDFEPIFDQLSREFPSVKKGLVAGANLDRKQLVKWNDQLANYKGDYDAVIIHYYYTARELGDAYKNIQKIKYDPQLSFNALDEAFRMAYEKMEETDLIGEGLDYAEAKFPGKAIWITEWNTKPSDKLNNTLLNGAWQFSQMMQYGDRIEYFLVHNGVSPDKYGMISRRNKKFDDEKSELIRRSGYWSMAMALAVKDGNMLSRGKNAFIPAGRETTYWFTNLDDAYPPSVTFNAAQFSEVRIYYVSGKHLYSSSGYTGYMKNGSKKSYELDGILTEPFTGTIPANSYGYIVWTPSF